MIRVSEVIVQTHLSERALLRFDHARAMWSTDPDGTAVVFIHGYGGDAIKTWADFNRILPQCVQCRHADLVFYGYDGLRSNIVASSGLFRDFLDALFTSGSDVVNESVPASAQRPAGFAFGKILIVAHSLGAVVARWALVSARRLPANWMGQTSLILFAPAHSGADVVRLATEAASGFKMLGLFSAFARFQSPLIDQLKAGSPELTTLATDTAAALHEGNSEYLKAKAVMIAEYERIVSNIRFCDDPEPKVFAGQDHFSICKPTDIFRGPADQVIAALK